MTLADELLAAGRLTEWLPHASRYVLSKADLQRMDSYAGDGHALHEMLPAVLPLPGPVWYEATVTAQHGTTMMLGYGATPAGPGQIDVWWACLGPGRLAGPLGPLRMDSQSVALVSEGEPGRILQAAAGIVVRALLMRLGKSAP